MYLFQINELLHLKKISRFCAVRCAQAPQLIYTSKRINWNYFINEINSDTDPVTMWPRIQTLNGSKPFPPIIIMKTTDDPKLTSDL